MFLVKLLEVSNNLYNKYNHYRKSIIPGSWRIANSAIFRLFIYKQWKARLLNGLVVRWTPDGAIRVRALAGALSCVLGQDTLLSNYWWVWEG